MLDLVALEAAVWSDVTRAAGIEMEGTVVVRGPGAHQVGDALLRLGVTTVIADESRLGPDPTEFARNDSVDGVVMLHAWSSPSAVDRAAAIGVAWLRRGGTLVLAELDMARLRSAPPSRYPAALFYAMHPEIAATLAMRSATSLQLAMAGVRAGLRDKTALEFDRPVGVFRTPAEHRAGIEFGSWRGLEMLDSRRYGAVVDAAAALEVEEWPLAELEPWIAVIGSARH